MLLCDVQCSRAFRDKLHINHRQSLPSLLCKKIYILTMLLICKKFLPKVLPCPYTPFSAPCRIRTYHLSVKNRLLLHELKAHIFVYKKSTPKDAYTCLFFGSTASDRTLCVWFWFSGFTFCVMLLNFSLLFFWFNSSCCFLFIQVTSDIVCFEREVSMYYCLYTVKGNRNPAAFLNLFSVYTISHYLVFFVASCSRTLNIFC